MKKIQVEQEGVEVKVDFKMVWGIMWRFYTIVCGIAFFLGMIITMFS